MSRQFKKQHNNKSKIDREPSQSGGAGTDYASFWYSPTPTNIHQLSQYTAKGLANTPMFNPLKADTTFATPTSGVIPTGIHLGNSPSPTNYYQSSKPLYLTGGSRVKNNLSYSATSSASVSSDSASDSSSDSDTQNEWLTFAKVYAKRNKMAEDRALSDLRCKMLYQIYSNSR